MTLHEKIRFIRKDKKKSQAEFGETLGVSRDVVANIENGRVIPRENMIKLICSTYDVDYAWLTEDEGEPYIKTKNSVIEKLAIQYNLDDFDKKIIGKYLELSPEDRSVLKNYIISLLN